MPNERVEKACISHGRLIRFGWHCGFLRIELIGAVGVAKVAEIMFTPQVPEQFVPVQIPFLAVLAQRMAAMRFIVWITFAPMRGQLLSGVCSPLEREYLEATVQMMEDREWVCVCVTAVTE